MTLNHYEHKLPMTEVLKGVAGFFGVRLGEQPRYEIKERIGDVEIRQYEPFAMVSTRVEGEYETASKIGFYRLADYIFGKNTESKILAMTAPVFLEREPIVTEDEDFSKTLAVYHDRRRKGWIISFVLPLSFTHSTAPRPIDDHIVITESEPGLVAVLGYSGVSTWDKVEDKVNEMTACLTHHEKYDLMSEPRYAQYDAPIALPFVRKNEIFIGVAPKFIWH